MKINKHIAVSDSGFVFNPVTGESFTANPMGIEIIEMLKQERTIAEIHETLLQKYHTEHTTIEKDVADFFELLKNFSLIDRHETTEN
ncbi:MAG: PqqD family protein [Bacteroidetes bacterium]|nr:PqqD family protein [Bacteroidota bacterium]